MKQRSKLTVRQDRVRKVLDKKGREVWSLPPDATVYQAIQKMAEKSIGALMVVSGEGKLVGVLSERDYARKVILQNRLSRETLVGDIMTTSVVTVTADQTVDECLDLITRHRIRHLPVVEDGKLVGVVSIGDLVDNIISTQAETISHLNNYITGHR